MVNNSSPSPKPKTYNGDISTLPRALAHLREKPIWLCWRWTLHKDKWTKPPLRVDNPEVKASTADPTTWGAYKLAVRQVRAGKADGIGFALQGQNIGAFDLDHCHDPKTGRVEPWAQELLDQFPDAYREVTVSGKGFRIIGTSELVNFAPKFKLPDHGNGAAVELFSNSTHYLTLSCNEHGGCFGLPPIGDTMQAIAAKLGGGKCDGKEIGKLPVVDGVPPLAPTNGADVPATPWCEAEETRLRSAIMAIPADEKTLIEKFGSSHDRWVKYGRAIERLGWGEKGFAIWRDWCAQNSEKFDEKGLRKNWKSFWSNRNTRENPVTVGTIYYDAKLFGWNVEPLHPGDPHPGLGEWDAGEVDDNAIPPRGWLLGNVFCRGFVSSVIGDGGVGKTATRNAQLMSCAVGRSLTGEHVFQRCRVLMISLEDDDKELRRRIRAACLHHQVERDELKGWFFVAAPGRSAGKLLTVDKDGKLVPAGLAEKIEKVIQERRIDIVSLDPFVKSHAVGENDNIAIDAVVEILTQLAAKYDIAVDVPHHISKGQADPGNANRGRGASSMKDAARLVYTLTPMTLEEAKGFDLDEAMRRSLIRMDSGKVNIAPPMAEAKWFHLVGVPIGNGTDLYPNGDMVQTVEPWTPPDKWAGLSHHLLNQILTDIDAGLPDGNRYTDGSNAKERAAWQVVVKRAPNKSEADAKGIIKAWVKSGLLVSYEYDNPTTRKKVKGFRVDNSKRPSSTT
jgi:AAA domain/Primase C terminal 2 (PriCT-2)